jgi:hypothetical protein
MENNEMEEPGNINEFGDNEFIDDEDDEELSVAEKVIGVFISPGKTFKYLSERPDFWSPFIIISLVLIACGMLYMTNLMPMLVSDTIAKTQIELEAAGMSESEITEIISAMAKYLPYVFYGQTVIGQPIGILIVWLLLTLGVFFIGLIQGLKTDFKKLFGVLPWISFIGLLPVQIITTIIYMSGRVTEMADMQNMRIVKPYSLLSLFPESIELPKFALGVLGTIDPFYIWSLIVMVIALEHVNNSKRSQAIITTAIIAVIGLVLSGVMTNLAP